MSFTAPYSTIQAGLESVQINIHVARRKTLPSDIHRLYILGSHRKLIWIRDRINKQIVYLASLIAFSGSEAKSQTAKPKIKQAPGRHLNLFSRTSTGKGSALHCRLGRTFTTSLTSFSASWVNKQTFNRIQTVYAFECQHKQNWKTRKENFSRQLTLLICEKKIRGRNWLRRGADSFLLFFFVSFTVDHTICWKSTSTKRFGSWDYYIPPHLAHVV